MFPIIIGFQSHQSALNKLLPGQWKQKKFEWTGDKYNSKKTVTQVSVQYLLNVGGLSIDIIFGLFVNILTNTINHYYSFKIFPRF